MDCCDERKTAIISTAVYILVYYNTEMSEHMYEDDTSTHNRTYPTYLRGSTYPTERDTGTHQGGTHIHMRSTPSIYSVFFLVLRTNHIQTHDLVMNDEIRPDRRGTWVDERGTTVHARLHATLHGVSVRHFDTLVHSLLKPRRP